LQLCPSSRHSVPLRSKYSPQHPALKHPQFMFLPRTLDTLSVYTYIYTYICIYTSIVHTFHAFWCNWLVPTAPSSDHHLDVICAVRQIIVTV
jgi:hypothetical protein